MNVLLGVTGSIAAYKAADIIRRLKQKEMQVKVVMTPSAEAFITPLTLGTLSEGKVYQKMFDDSTDSWDMPHLSLSQWADLFLIAPATANIIGKIAGGLADNLLTSLALSTQSPILIAPAMNEAMWANSLVQDNCALLKEKGVKFIGPVKGALACGAEGDGRMAEVDTIVNAAVSVLRCKEQLKRDVNHESRIRKSNKK